MPSASVEIGAFGALDEGRSSADGAKGAHGRVDAAGEEALGALLEGLGLGVAGATQRGGERTHGGISIVARGGSLRFVGNDRANAARILVSGSSTPKHLPLKKVWTVPKETAPKSVTYADAGVDLVSGERAKERIKYLAQKTFNRNVLGGIGSFGAMFRLDMQRWKNPILVSSADGVGTKLKIAFELGLHQTVGVDLVNHCVNDIAVQGATPLFFLDYLAMGKLDPDVIETVAENGETSILVLKPDHSFQQELSEQGEVKRATGTWHRMGEGGIGFSKEFLAVSGQEADADGSAYADIHKDSGFCPSRSSFASMRCSGTAESILHLLMPFPVPMLEANPECQRH